MFATNIQYLKKLRTASDKFCHDKNFYDVDHTPQHSSVASLYLAIIRTQTPSLTKLSMCSQQLVALQCVHVVKQL